MIYKKNYHLIKNDIDVLKKIHDNFIYLFSKDISDYLSINKVHVKLSELKIEIDSNNIKDFKKPIILNIMEINKFKDSFLIIFSSDFVSMIIEHLFGDNKSKINNNHCNKKITNIECKIFQNITEIIIKGYEESFKKFFPIKIKYTKYKIITNKDDVSHFKMDTFVITTFQMMIGSIKGIFSIIIPLIIIKKNLLNTDSIKKIENYKNNGKENILKNVYDLDLILTVKLTESVICLSNILKLKLGDVIPIKKPENGIVYIDDCPILLGKYKIVNGRHALCVDTLIGSNIKS